MAGDRADNPTQVIPAVAPRGRCLPVSDLLAREQHAPRPQDEPGEPGRPPTQRWRRLAGASAALLAVGGAVVVGEVIAQAPQHAPQVEQQREAAPNPRPPATKATARDVVRAAKPAPSTPEEQVRAVMQQPERPAPPPAEQTPQQQWDDYYRDMAKQLREQYGQN